MIFHRIKFIFYHFHNENFNIFILNINFQIIYQSEQQNFNRTKGVFKDMKQIAIDIQEQGLQK